MLAWIKAIRIRTLPAALVPVLVGASLAGGKSLQRPDILIVTTLCAVLIQIITNLANDLFDFEKGADTDQRIGPTRVTQAGLISPQQMKKGLAVIVSLTLLLGLYLVLIGGWPILIIGVLSILFAFLYTAGHFALAYQGLGEVFVVIFFGPVAVAGTLYLFTSGISSSSILQGIAIGLVATTLLVINNIRDYSTDIKCDKKTLVVRFGETFGKCEFSALHILAVVLIITSALLNNTPWILVSLLYLAFALQISKEVWRIRDYTLFNGLLARSSAALMLFGLLLVIGNNL